MTDTHHSSRVQRLCAAAHSLIDVMNIDDFTDDDREEMDSVLSAIIGRIRKEPIRSKEDAIAKVRLASLDIEDTEADDPNLDMLQEAFKYLTDVRDSNRRLMDDLSAGLRLRVEQERGGTPPA
jgi:hypothetical protein